MSLPLLRSTLRSLLCIILHNPKDRAKRPTAWRSLGFVTKPSGTRTSDVTCGGIWSEERQAKDDAILAQQRERVEGELQALHAGLAKKGCTKRFDKVVVRLGRLKERYRRVPGQYTLRIEKATDAADPARAESATGNAAGTAHGSGTGTTGKGGGRRTSKPGKQPVLAAAVLWERNRQHTSKDARAGTYVLRTSHTDWTLERVVRTYWQQTEIEATFRSPKSEVGLRPIWHEKPDRIRAQLFIAVLAYCWRSHYSD